jgi:hypothetical protein
MARDVSKRLRFVAFPFLPALFSVGFFVGTPSPYTLERADEISTY